MTRLHPAVPSARTLRALTGIFAVLVLAVVATGCAGGAPAVDGTPDPFVGLADRSDQAFRQGLEFYGQGQYREALTSFEQARLLSPTVDERITQMIERCQVALAPRPTAVAAPPTELPATPAATPVSRATQTPDTELGSRYFGNVSLGLVPTSPDLDASAVTQFFYQDQIGLHLEGLKQHLNLPFTVRVFNADSGRLVAELQSTDVATVLPMGVPTRMPPANAATAPPETATPAAAVESHLVRFFDSFVWYHQGGDEPGHYLLQLFANGVLTNNFEYSVGTVPMPTVTPTAVVVQEQPTPEPVPRLPTPIDVPAPAAAAAPAAGESRTAPAPAPAVSAPATTEPTSTPAATPTMVPTPANAYTTAVGGVVAGLDVDSRNGRFYLADTTGIIWSSDAPTGQLRPTLNTPFNIGDRQPVDMVVDQSSGNLYLSTRVCAPAAPGCVLAVDGRTGAVMKSIALPGAPGDLRIDSGLGLLYVAIPERQALAEIDMRGGNLMRTIDGLPQITSLALDPVRHTLYAAHLAGQVSVIDVPSAQVTARVAVTGVGLSSVATGRGLAYAVNTATHEIAVLEPLSQAVGRYPLSEEPAAVSASEATGAVYVLSSRANVILQMDPTNGFELGRVLLASRSGRPALQARAAQTLRPRMVLNVDDQTVFASLPDSGSLAAVTVAQFPVSAYAIPYVELGGQASAGSIPGVWQPAADALPSQPRAEQELQALPPSDQQATPANSNEEGL